MAEIAILYGALFYSLVGLTLFLIMQDYFPRTFIGKMAALLAAVVCSQLGIVIFLALSGMDTMLFLALGLLAILAFTRRRFTATGLFLGLLLLARIEGLALFITINLLYLLVNKHAFRLKEMGKVLLLPLLIWGPYLLYKCIITGSPLPTSLAGRKWLCGMQNQVFFLQPATMDRVVAFFKAWYIFLDNWVFQAYSLNAFPILRIAYEVCIFGLLLCGALVLLKASLAIVKGEERSKAGAAILLWWFVSHNIAYIALMPIASWRHQAINWVMVGILLSSGLFSLHRFIAPLRPSLPPLARALSFALLIFVPSTVQWHRNYIDYVRHINQVHVQAGQWIDANLPADAIVAAFDIGAVKYFGRRETIDLGGLTDSEYTFHYLYLGRVLDFMEQAGTTHLAMVETDDNQGGLAYRLGIYGSYASTRMVLQPLQSFHVTPYIRPPFTSLPDYYFYPAYRKMVIYSVDWFP